MEGIQVIAMSGGRQPLQPAETPLQDRAARSFTGCEARHRIADGLAEFVVTHEISSRYCHCAEYTLHAQKTIRAMAQPRHGPDTDHLLGNQDVASTMPSACRRSWMAMHSSLRMPPMRSLRAVQA